MQCTVKEDTFVQICKPKLAWKELFLSTAIPKSTKSAINKLLSIQLFKNDQKSHL